MASIAHVSKYLMVREALESRGTDSEVDVQLAEDESGWQYKISIVNSGGDTIVSLCYDIWCSMLSLDVTCLAIAVHNDALSSFGEGDHTGWKT